MKTASVNSVSVMDKGFELGKKLVDMFTNIDYLNAAFKYYSPEQIDSFAKKAAQMFP